jgi:ankyrin repeat protein
MTNGMRKLAMILFGAMLLVSVPAAAQMYSDGFKFLKAVKDKDGDTAIKMLDEPGTTVVNARDISTGESGLHIAVARRDLTWLSFLLGKGANPNLADRKGVTPLMLATQLGFAEGVQVLASGGARVDVANDAGETPLISAVHRRDVTLMRILLKAGADPDRTDNSGRSARDYAKLDAGNALTGEIERNAKKDAGGKPVYGPSIR